MKKGTRLVDLGGLSMTDPEKYRKIYYVRADKGVKKDFLDIVDTDPLEENDIVYEDTTVKDVVAKLDVTKMLRTLTPREEKMIRLRFGIGVPASTFEEVGCEFSLTRERIRTIIDRALRKIKNHTNYWNYK